MSSDTAEKETSLYSYLNQVDESRADFKCSLEFTHSLLKKNQAETSNTPPLPPLSELNRATEMYYVALNDSKWSSSSSSSTDSSNNAQRKPPPLGPECLVGKPIKLYCPLDESYHTGRIIDWRSCHTDRAPFFGQGRIGSCEFLVRWIEKENGRVIHWWIVLEEHAVAVGVALVYAKKGSHKQYSKWKPGFLLVRSALEVMPWRNAIIEQPCWGLISFLDGMVMMDDATPTKPSSVIYLDLDKDVVDYLSPSFRECRNNELLIMQKQSPVEATTTKDSSILMASHLSQDFLSTHNPNTKVRVRLRDTDEMKSNSITLSESPIKKMKKSSPFSPSSGGESSSSIEEQALDRLAIFELEEQRRIFHWHTLPLVNAYHPMALSILDESMLPPLEIQHPLDSPPHSNNNNEKRMKPGIDRLWISQLLARKQGKSQQQDQKEKESLDRIASIAVSPVSSLARAMASLPNHPSSMDSQV